MVDGGSLGSRKHINLPGVHVNLPAIAGKDREDILFGMAQDLDFLALSFVRSAEDIAAARELLGKKALKIIAKIEDREGLSNVEEITQAADGVMVARGDLGIEVDIAVMPNIQRNLVRTCARLGKRCVVATHLLESMIENPIPTRAEVTDVANAIYEGVDAIMLSAETSVGRHPVRCVAQLSRIAVTSEQFPSLGFAADFIADTDKHHVAKAAAGLAEAIGAAGIGRHYPPRRDGRPGHELPAADGADIRLLQQQPDASAADDEPGRVLTPHRLFDSAREDDPDGAQCTAAAGGHSARRARGGDFGRARPGRASMRSRSAPWAVRVRAGGRVSWRRA